MLTSSLSNCIAGNIFEITYNITEETKISDLAGINLKYNSIQALTVIAEAAAKGNIALVNSLGDKVGYRLINSCDENGNTPLHFVCKMILNLGFIDNNVCTGIQKLLSLGAKPNATNFSGERPSSNLLTLAVVSGNNLLNDFLLHRLHTPKKAEKAKLVLASKIDENSTLSIFPHELIEKFLISFIDITLIDITLNESIHLEDDLLEKADSLIKEGKQEAALVYYRMAADDGDIEAIEFLFDHYQLDIQRHIIMENAFEFCKDEALKGNTKAINLMGHFHKFELGTSHSPKEACNSYKKAAALGCPNGHYNLGVFYEQTIYYTKALEHYLKAAEYGHAGAQTKIGLIYFQGIGVEENKKLGVKYLQLAVEQNYQEAIAWLSYAYLKGEGVDQSVSTAEALQKRLIVIPSFLRDAFMNRMIRA